MPSAAFYCEYLLLRNLYDQIEAIQKPFFEHFFRNIPIENLINIEDINLIASITLFHGT